MSVARQVRFQHDSRHKRLQTGKSIQPLHILTSIVRRNQFADSSSCQSAPSAAILPYMAMTSWKVLVKPREGLKELRDRELESTESHGRAQVGLVSFYLILLCRLVMDRQCYQYPIHSNCLSSLIGLHWRTSCIQRAGRCSVGFQSQAVGNFIW